MHETVSNNGENNGLAPLAPQQVDDAALMLARAFHDHPAVTHLFPKPQRRERALPHVWSGACRYVLRYGEVWTVPGLAGVACWLPPGATHKTLPRMLAAGMGSFLYRLRPPELIRNIVTDMYADALHARYAPGAHWYLFIIGVEPACQGQGIGAALLGPVLARADRAAVPVYLETHTPRNAGFYRRHGFEVVVEGRTPGSNVPVYGMLRQPPGAPGLQDR